ncbi:MAG TPA: 6,7-dimethyl-8-ribityllumazine synthase [Methanomicrobia archaeon]|nr:6,7-dimethyl-8-ribityllumazine synthase [Methanomicrobia archaeon]
MQEEIKLGFVVSEFHRDITYQMEILGREHAEFLGAKVVRSLYVPGTFDIPLAVKKMLSEGDEDGSEEREVDAVVTLGCIIKGATGHDEMIAAQMTRKIMDLSLEYGKPVTLGVSGPGMTRLEAQERVEYAKRGVEAAVKMVKRLRE